MQRTGARPDFGVRAAELARLACAPGAQGPYVSLYMETEAAVENAAPLSEAHWRVLRDELTGQGAPEVLLEKIDPMVPEAHHFGGGFAVVAGREGLLHVENLPELRTPEMARWAPLASIGPLIRWRQLAPVHILVLTDHRGADIFSFGLGTPTEQRQAGVADWPIHKSPSGGWSQRHHQVRVENTWERNAKDVAEQVESVCSRSGTRLVAIAGDPRASAMVREALPPEIQEMVREISGGRSPDGSDDRVTEEIASLLTLEANRVDDDLAEIIQADRDARDRAVTGWSDVLEALAAARVDLLVVEDNPSDAATAWFGEEPVQVAYSEARLRDMGVDAPVEARRVDAAIRAALGTGASVRIAEGEGRLAGEPAALLRWSERP